MSEGTGILICDKCMDESYTQYYFGTCALCYTCFVKKIEKELIEEFLPHLDWALNELHPTHYNNEEYQDACSYYKKLKERSKQK